MRDRVGSLILSSLRVSATTLCVQAHTEPWGIDETQGPDAETLSVRSAYIALSPKRPKENHTCAHS